MNKERIETLLRQISEIVTREKTQQEEKRKRGENFNIFSVLGLSTSEVRLHSAFLTELLNPNGNHGLGDKFLKSFFDTIVKRVEPNFEFETKSAIANSEFYIGSISEDYTEGGRIDILIQDKNNHAIVIENKIFAGDQEKQLIRYQNYAKKTVQKYVMLYLALDTKQASEYSTSNQVNYKCISYKDDILPWLQQCIGIAALNPQVREIIAQYKFNLETILNIMSEANNQAIMSLLLNESNIEVTLKIRELSEDIGKTIRQSFIEKKLFSLAEKYNMNCSYDKDFLNLGKRGIHYKNIRFIFRGYEKCYFQIENEGNTVYYGIVADGYPENLRTVMGQFEDWTDVNNKWPYGSKFFPGNLKWWDGFDSLTDMVKGNKIREIIDNELSKIKEHRLIEKYSELMDSKVASNKQTET